MGEYFMSLNGDLKSGDFMRRSVAGVSSSSDAEVLVTLGDGCEGSGVSRPHGGAVVDEAGAGGVPSSFTRE